MSFFNINLLKKVSKRYKSPVMNIMLMGGIEKQKWLTLVQKDYERCQKCGRELKNLDRGINGFSVYCDACDLGYYVGKVADVYYERFYTYSERCAVCDLEISKADAGMHFLETINNFKYNVFALGICDNCKQSQFYQKLENIILDEEVKAAMIFDARRIFACLKDNKKFRKYSHEKMVELALKLACDENGCIVEFDLKMSHLAVARKITGIKQRMTPAEYIEAQMMVLARNNEDLSINRYNIESQAKEILGKLEPSGHNPAVLSAAVIYICSNKVLSQREIEKSLNISQVSISNVSRKIRNELDKI